MGTRNRDLLYSISVWEEIKTPGHAFLSYVRQDSALVDRLDRRLTDAGILVWRDTANLWPGADWRRQIRQAITDNTLAFIACFSRASTRREKSYQNEELALAIEQFRLRNSNFPWLFPVRLDDCDIPDLDIGGGRTLSSLQRADLFGDRYDESSAVLVAAVQRAIYRPPSPPGRAFRITGVSDVSLVAHMRPRTYSDARLIGNYFRAGKAVVVVLANMDDSDAKRLLDFIAGMIFNLKGSTERLTNRIFLLSPHGVELTLDTKVQLAKQFIRVTE